ncbi:MAG: hypothetical protein U0U67_02820 [Chitinophagales bacterium]
MALILLFIILPILAIVIAVFSDKIRDKFIFEKQSNEEIIEVEVDVVVLQQNDKNDFTKGLIYLTNQRIIFFKYKYNWLDLIPIIGSSLMALFIDKNSYWQLPLAQLNTYHFAGKVVQNQNHSTVTTHGYTTLITKNNELYKFDIPLDWQTHQKSKWLVQLDKIIAQKDNPNFFS